MGLCLSYVPIATAHVVIHVHAQCKIIIHVYLYSYTQTHGLLTSHSNDTSRVTDGSHERNTDTVELQSARGRGMLKP